MADTVISTAAFFAKKKKKKAFKFNANKVDASKVTSTVHVDAPAVSGVEGATSSLNTFSISNESNTLSDGGQSGEQWDDNTVTVASRKSVVASNGSGPTELMDMKALERKRNEQDDIVERLRVEDTKAALAAARDGMEKEAQRLKEARNSKSNSNGDSSSTKPRFGAAAANYSNGKSSDGGGTWMSTRTRGGFSAEKTMAKPSSSGYQKKVDTFDENLFPDLATADKIIADEEEQKQKRSQTLPKKTKLMIKKIDKPVAKQQPAPIKKEKDAPIAVVDKSEEKYTPPAAASSLKTKKDEQIETVTTSTATKKKKKKKKKDLSTFKAS